MAISPAHCLYDEEAQMQIMSMTNENQNDAAADDAGLEDNMKGLEEDLKGIRARLAALQDEDDVLLPESWDWAEGVEAASQRAAEEMKEEEEAMQRALSSPSLRLRPRDEAALRAQAALRADVEEVAAAARRLMEADLRRLAADAETGRFSYVMLLTHEEMAAAARTEEVAVRLEEWFASLAARLTRGAAEFAATPGEEAFVAAMRREAAKADEVRSVLAWYRAGSGSSVQPAGGGAAGHVARAKLIMAKLMVLVVVFMFCKVVTRTSFF